jgi:hypothetical protein
MARASGGDEWWWRFLCEWGKEGKIGRIVMILEGERSELVPLVPEAWLGQRMMDAGTYLSWQRWQKWRDPVTTIGLPPWLIPAPGGFHGLRRSSS